MGSGYHRFAIKISANAAFCVYNFSKNAPEPAAMFNAANFLETAKSKKRKSARVVKVRKNIFARCLPCRRPGIVAK